MPVAGSKRPAPDDTTDPRPPPQHRAFAQRPTATSPSMPPSQNENPGMVASSNDNWEMAAYLTAAPPLDEAGGNLCLATVDMKLDMLSVEQCRDILRSMARKSDSGLFEISSELARIEYEHDSQLQVSERPGKRRAAKQKPQLDWIRLQNPVQAYMDRKLPPNARKDKKSARAWKVINGIERIFGLIGNRCDSSAPYITKRNSICAMLDYFNIIFEARSSYTQMMCKTRHWLWNHWFLVIWKRLTPEEKSQFAREGDMIDRVIQIASRGKLYPGLTDCFDWFIPSLKKSAGAEFAEHFANWEFSDSVAETYGV